METRTTSFTLQEYSNRLQTEALQVPFVAHTCEHCAKLLIKWTPAAPHGVDLFCNLEGLAQISIFEAATSGCPLFAGWLPYCDWDNWTEENSWQFYFRIGPNLRKKDPTGQAVVQLDKGGFQAWIRVLDADGVGFEDLSPRYALSLDEGANDPSWLLKSPMWRASAASDEAFANAKEWLQDCHHSGTHQQCVPTPDNFVPSRLIRIPRDEESSHIEIVETKESEFVAWCALSYCWGGPQPSQTTTSNFQWGLRIVRLSELPKTILDAVVAASKLSVPYLWVDSLCILQDDPEDVKRELAHLPKIYKHSVFTLIASTASSSLEGFLSVRDFNREWNNQPVRLRYEDESGELSAIILHDLTTHDVPEPVDLRAWTLQERLLSPRALVFGSSTLSWSCLSHTRHESALMPQESLQMSLLLKHARDITLKDNMEEQASSYWKAIITQYSQRKLSFADDKLIAIAAVAEEFGVTKQWDYVAGLWRQEIRNMSVWFYDQTTGNRRPNKYRAPSWSWASVDSEHRLWMVNIPLPDIIDVVTEPETQELPYGNTKSGYITGKGKAVSIYLQRGHNRPKSLSLNEEGDAKAFLSESRGASYNTYLDAPEDDFDDWHKCVGWEVYLVTLGSRTDYKQRYPALVLKPISMTENVYRRVGVLFADPDSEILDLFEGIEPKRLTIV